MAYHTGNDALYLPNTYEEARALLHRLWSKAVDTPGYNKQDWSMMEALVENWLRLREKIADLPRMPPA